MAQNENTQTLHLVLRPASLALKIVVAVLILCSVVALSALRWVHTELRAQTQKLLEEAAAVEYANQRLEEKVGKTDSVQNVRTIAKEELGLVDPNTILINPIS